MPAIPLVVDLDGTLLYTDMLLESALGYVRSKGQMLQLLFCLVQGKSFLKRALAEKTKFDPATLPYNMELIEWIKEERLKGRPVILCTASDLSIAMTIANHLAIFDDVLASDGTINLAGEKKAAALVKRFGRLGFDYVGNANVDMAVWQQARRAIVVNSTNQHLLEKVAEISELERVFYSPKLNTAIVWHMLRLHQWLKNVLLFVPLFAAHQWMDLEDWTTLALAFLSFSFCASVVYIANDLLDLESDRQHPRKRERPFASGKIPIWIGVLCIPLLLIIAFTLAFFINYYFCFCLLLYFILTCLYSFGLKRLVLIDWVILALLYTLRIVAGGFSVGITSSFWLLVFSVFLFLSLAFVKRYAELQAIIYEGKQEIHGRGYNALDAPIIQMFGVASGYVSVLILALYLNSPHVIQLYPSSEFIWGCVFVLLFWISWIWIQAHRGHMHDDPLVFALKNKTSLASGLFFVTFLILGSI